MMKLVRDNTSAPVVTESNAECYMDSIDGLLTLVAYNPPTITTSDYSGQVFASCIEKSQSQLQQALSQGDG